MKRVTNKIDPHVSILKHWGKYILIVMRLLYYTNYFINKIYEQPNEVISFISHVTSKQPYIL